MIDIKRKNVCKTPTRFNIVLKGLPPRYQRILKENLMIKKYSTDDRFINALFSMEDKLVRISHLTKPYIHPVTREVMNRSSVLDSYNEYDWHCAYCKSPIKSRIDNFDSSNFTCSKCFNYYLKGSKKIDQRIIDSSLEFTDHCKKLFKENQKMFIKYVKRNENKI